MEEKLFIMGMKELEEHIEKAWQGSEKNYYVCISVYYGREGYDDNFRATDVKDLKNQLIEWLKLNDWCVEALWDIEITATDEEVELEF